MTPLIEVMLRKYYKEVVQDNLGMKSDSFKDVDWSAHEKVLKFIDSE